MHTLTGLPFDVSMQKFAVKKRQSLSADNAMTVLLLHVFCLKTKVLQFVYLRFGCECEWS